MTERLASYLLAVQCVYIDAPAAQQRQCRALAASPSVKPPPKMDVIVASKSSQQPKGKKKKDAAAAAKAVEVQASVVPTDVDSSPARRHPSAALSVASLAALEEMSAGPAGAAMAELQSLLPAAAASDSSQVNNNSILPFFPHLEVYAVDSCEELQSHTAAFLRLQAQLLASSPLRNDSGSSPMSAAGSSFALDGQQTALMLVPQLFYAIPKIGGD